MLPGHKNSQNVQNICALKCRRTSHSLQHFAIWAGSALLRFLMISILVNTSTRDNLPENYLSEVGFEPTPTDVDCDLNAAP